LIGGCAATRQAPRRRQRCIVTQPTAAALALTARYLEMHPADPNVYGKFKGNSRPNNPTRRFLCHTFIFPLGIQDKCDTLLFSCHLMMVVCSNFLGCCECSTDLNRSSTPKAIFTYFRGVRKMELAVILASN
jgi:hypothetical protein